MIVLARRDEVRPHKPFPSHAKTPDMFCQPWRGWLEAIEDLVPGLPDSHFAEWHKARMPAELLNSILIGGGNTKTGYFRERAFVVSNFDTSRDATIRNGDEPIWTVRSNEFRRPSSVSRAFIADTKLNGNSERLTIRDGESPAFAVTANHFKSGGVRAFIVHPNGMRSHNPPRAAVCGRTVSMTPRCYARWQDVPDWFTLPDSNELACRGIGNGVPLNLTRACLRSLGFEPVASARPNLRPIGGAS
jgi:site-specific DNA-cytosine methylase